MIRWVVATMGLALLATTAVAQDRPLAAPGNSLLDAPIIVEPDVDYVFVDPETGQVTLREKHSKESALQSRIEKCMEQGNSSENCKCRAEATARILEESDFLEETWHLETENPTGLRDFQNRMLAEQPDRMFELGEALGQCPATFMKLE